MFDLDEIEQRNSENMEFLDQMAAKGAPIERPHAADVIAYLVHELRKSQVEVAGLRGEIKGLLDGVAILKEGR